MSLVVTKSKVEKYIITPDDGDQIEVILEEPVEGYKTIIMSSYDSVFKFGWGACGPCLRQFMVGRNDSYLAGKFLKNSDCINVEKTTGKLIDIIESDGLGADGEVFCENLRGIDDDIDRIDHLWSEICEANACHSIKYVALDEYLEFEEFFMGDFVEMEPTREYRHLFGYIWPHVKAVFEKELEEEYQESMGMSNE